jgi:hypothetical protein
MKFHCLRRRQNTATPLRTSVGCFTALYFYDGYGFWLEWDELLICYTVCSKIRCALIKGFGSDVHERRYSAEPNLRTVA